MTLADAIIDGNIEKVKKLLSSGSEINTYDEYGFTPLIESILMRKPEITSLLLSNKADPNFKDTTGRTPLHWAVEINDVKICKELLNLNADPNQYTTNSQPILTFPLLRRQKKLVDLLTRYGAKISFAKAFINTKILGHCYELSGETYMLSTQNKLILVNFEGFYLESSLNIIADSLKRFLNNYSAKKLRMYFDKLKYIIKALHDSAELSKLQHFIYTTDDRKNISETIFSNDLLILPGVYQGHAITFIIYKNYFAKCDRGANSKFEGTGVIYQITKQFDRSKLFNEIIFQKNNDEFMHRGINEIMGLKTIINLPIPPQKTGNCSWANVEATVPTAYFLLDFFSGEQNNNHEEAISKSMNIFSKWREWDKDRALNEFVQRFERSNKSLKAAIASVFGSVLINIIATGDVRDKKRVKIIINTLRGKDYSYVINSYRKIFYERHKTKIGKLLEEFYTKYYF